MGRPATILLVLLLAACGGNDAPSDGTAPLEPAAPPAVAPEEARAPAPPPPPAPAPEILSEAWYDRIVSGQKAGWLHVVWTRGERDGRPVVHDRTEIVSLSTRSMGGMRDRFSTRTVVEVVREPSGGLLELRSVSEEAGRETETTVTFTGDGYDRVERVPHRERRLRVDCGEPCPTDAEAFLSERAARGGLEPGQELSYRSPNYLAGTLETVNLVVEDIETLALPGGPARCYRVRESVEGRPVRSTLWIDPDGVMRRVRSEGTEIVSTTPAQARTMPTGGYRFSVTVRAEPVLPRCTSFTRSVVEVVLDEREGVHLPEFPASPFSREIGREGRRIRLELTAHDDPGADVGLPVADEALAEHLEPTNLLCSDAPVVREAARRAADGAANGREAARRLLRFVFLTLEKGSGPTASPNAAEILGEGRGDCSEHAVLFVALCRAIGLPARLVSGYAQVGETWGSHLFAEIWLGRWIGADPTTNELGTRARYICFGWPDDPDSYPGLVSARIRDRIRIRTLSFTDAGETVDLTEPAPADPRSDSRSGLSFAEPPDGWTAELLPEPGQASFTGPGVRGRVVVVSGLGDLPIPVLHRTVMPGGERVRFGEEEALIEEHSFGRGGWISVVVPWRRRLLDIGLTITGEADREGVLATLAAMLAPTLAPREDGPR